MNVGLAVCEDFPMLILTLSYIQNLDQKPDATMLISMMMSAGMVYMCWIRVRCHAGKILQVYLKCGKVLLVKSFIDTKNDLSGRLLRNAR